MLSRQAIIDAARECIGTPFRHQGRLPNRGMDCVGLVRWPLVVLTGTTEDYRAYTLRPDERDVRRIFIKYFKQKLTDPNPGDILIMHYEHNAQHFAILTYENTIIHAVNDGPCKVVEHGFRHPWPSRCVGVYEYPEVEPWQPSH